jgi:hypothetical protein
MRGILAEGRSGRQRNHAPKPRRTTPGRARGLWFAFASHARASRSNRSHQRTTARLHQDDPRSAACPSVSIPRLRPLLPQLTVVFLATLVVSASACGDARYREPGQPASGHRSPPESSGITLPNTTAHGGQGALAGGVVDAPLGVRAQSAKYRLVNTALTPGAPR